MERISSYVRRRIFEPVVISRTTALGHTERLAALTSGTSSLEYLSRPQDVRSGGINDWDVHRKGFYNFPPTQRLFLDWVGQRSVTRTLHQGRVLASAAVMAPGSGRWRGWANLYLGLSAAALYPRHRYGTDGSDQVTIQVQTATAVARLLRSDAVADTMLWYISIQGGLSYGVSGWIKLLGAPWRDGTALGGVMRTTTYGHEAVWRYSQSHPRAAREFVKFLLAFECLFPLVYLSRGRVTRLMLTAANVFHAGNGVFMGLGRFVTSFASMHPAIAYTTAPNASLSSPRDDRIVPAFGYAGAMFSIAVAALAATRRLQTLTPWPNAHELPTRSGNELSVLSSIDAAHRDRPVIVVEPGLLSTAENLAWIIESIVHEDRHDIVTYCRAGYGPSRRKAPTPYTLQESVDDLVDVIAGIVAHDRRVILLGHSLGGEICRRAAHHLAGQLDAVIYLDASHPGELTRSKVQRESGLLLERNMNQMAVSLRWGLGALLAKPEWVDDLPAAYRRKANAHYNDALMWGAATREWAAVVNDFMSHAGTVEPLSSHALVISADETIVNDPEHGEMHRELADSHRAPSDPTRVVRELTVADSEHGSLVTNPHFADQTTDAIHRFLAAIETHQPTHIGTETPLMEVNSRG